MTDLETLDRTLLLARQLSGGGPEVNLTILESLRSVRVGIVADRTNASSPSGQYLIATLSWLVLAQGCQLVIDCPDVDMVTALPAISGSRLIQGIADLSADLIPSSSSVVVSRSLEADLVFVIGSTSWTGNARRSWRLSGGSWWGRSQPVDSAGATWTSPLPVGAGVAAAIAAAEPFKFAIANTSTSEFAPPIPELLMRTDSATVRLLDEDMEWPGSSASPIDLGRVDLVSAGAISNALLHVLAGIPGLQMQARVFDDEMLEPSNLNRYSLARQSDLGRLKTEVLSEKLANSFRIEGIPSRFDEMTRTTAPCILVGADNLEARWLAQMSLPEWLGIGATGDFMTLTSEHPRTWPCAGCLHPHDDGVDLPIPTVSFVSYWAGLLLASRLLARAIRIPPTRSRQALLLWPLRLDLPASLAWVPVLENPDCPLGPHNLITQRSRRRPVTIKTGTAHSHY